MFMGCTYLRFWVALTYHWQQLGGSYLVFEYSVECTLVQILQDNLMGMIDQTYHCFIPVSMFQGVDQRFFEEFILFISSVNSKLIKTTNL